MNACSRHEAGRSERHAASTLTIRKRAALEDYATPREEPAPAPEAPREFTREDAERVFKLHALATRGGTPAECEVASGKLAAFAKGFGMTPEAVVAKAREFLPDHEKTDGERERAAYAEKRKEVEKEAAKLREKLAQIETRERELRRDLKSRSREELMDLLIAATLQLEGLAG